VPGNTKACRQHEKYMPENTNARWQMILSLKFLINSQLKWFKQREKEEKKISVSLFLCIKATIPGTHGRLG
jgi:hypothetical protein